MTTPTTAPLSDRDAAAIHASAPGAARRQALEVAARDQWHADQADAPERALPEWVRVEGVDVLRIPGAPVVAVPCYGRRHPRAFDLIDLDTREHLCQVRVGEVRGWLLARAEG